jgi:hypothetical protein
MEDQVPFVTLALIWSTAGLGEADDIGEVRVCSMTPKRIAQHGIDRIARSGSSVKHGGRGFRLNKPASGCFQSSRINAEHPAAERR